MSLDLSQINSNSWLAGFAEGDASFEIRASDGTRTRIETTFDLVQSRIDPKLAVKYMPIMELIAGFLIAKVSTTLVTNKTGTVSTRMRVRNTSRQGATKLVRYFGEYPLFSSKWLDYLNWRQVHSMVFSKQATTPKGLVIVQAFKTNHNASRSVFSWDHHGSFYTR
jgi:hypothetical protein